MASSSSVAVVADEPAELEAAVRALGCEVVELDRCDVVVVALRAEATALAALPDRPVVASIERTGAYPEASWSSVQSRADAYCLGTSGLTHAIAWAIGEDRAARSRGQPRLTVIGSMRDDLGGYRVLGPEPTIIGRALTFGYHPQRPDRMPTPIGSIARAHARVRCVEGVVSVLDLQSTLGTLVLRSTGAVLLCPQEQRGGGVYGPPASAWLARDPSGAWTPLAIGDHLQLHGFWRFRIDGDPA